MKKKIIFINKNFWSFYNFRFYLAKLILSKNRDTEITSIYGGRKNVKHFIKIKNLKLKRVNLPQIVFSPIQDIKFFFNVIKIIKEIKPDIVHLWNPKPVMYGTLASKLFTKRKIKTYITITGLGHGILTKNIILKTLINWMYFFAIQLSDVVFFQNKDDLNFFKKKNFLVKKKIKITPGLGVQIPSKIKCKINNKKVKFCFLGRLTSEKGYFDYIKSIELFRKKMKELNNKVQYQFQIVDFFDIKSTVAVNKGYFFKKNKINNIKVIKFDSKISKIFSKFDVLVYPSYREGSSKTLMEACAHKKIIITTNVPGCNNIIKHNYNGFLVDKKNPQSLCNAYLKCMNLKDKKILKLKSNAYKYSVKKFDEKKLCLDFMKFYK